MISALGLHRCKSCKQLFAFPHRFAQDLSAAEQLRGYWRVAEIHGLTGREIDLFGSPRLIFDRDAITDIQYGLVAGSMSSWVRYGLLEGAHGADFEWFGYEGDEDACGHGWSAISGDRLVGEIRYHFESWGFAVLHRNFDAPGRFVAVRPAPKGRRLRRMIARARAS